jgi:hypothetical protein
MSQATLALKGLARVAVLSALVLTTATTRYAHADPCADACRSQHNNCRMSAKLLFSPRCDAALQNCISGCFTRGRFDRGDRHNGRGNDERGHDERGSREFRGPPDMRDSQGPREFRGLPEMHDSHGPRGPGNRR